MTGNVTVAPSELASAAQEMEITEVRDLRSGVIYDTRRFIEGRRYDRLVKTRNILREAMRREKPRLACAICGTNVYLVARTDKSFFFRHAIEDGSCPAKTKESLTFDQIRALKYQGARESEAHIKIKTLIERGLLADHRVSEVSSEKNWRSTKDMKVRRRPDVSARFGSVRIAFEAQLSTTFLDVVVGRRIFYKDEGALLVWILPWFDPAYRRMTDDDILFMNNSNILVVDAETAQLSEATGKFTLRCHYREPFLDGLNRAEVWKSRIVNLGELTLDLNGQRAFWFDFDRADAELHLRREELLAEERQKKEEERRRRQEERIARLRAEFFAFWEDNANWHSENDYEDEEWDGLRDRFADIGIALPVNHKSNRHFRPVVSALASIKEKRVIGSDHKKLIQIAHHIADQYKPYVLLFGWAVKTYEVGDILAKQDKSEKWAAKRAVIRDAIKANDPAYSPDNSWDDALRFLFPELAAHIGPTATKKPSQ